jgi:hypothetical protein
MSRFLIALALALTAQAAAAAPPASCAHSIERAEAYLAAHPEASGTRRQTVDAQLMHQPTQAAVAKAKQESREGLAGLLTKARSQQRAGDLAGCEATLADVMRMLAP